jgi:hypothetical protein
MTDVALGTRKADYETAMIGQRTVAQGIGMTGQAGESVSLTEKVTAGNLDKIERGRVIDLEEIGVLNMLV